MGLLLKKRPADNRPVKPVTATEIPTLWGGHWVLFQGWAKKKKTSGAGGGGASDPEGSPPKRKDLKCCLLTVQEEAEGSQVQGLPKQCPSVLSLLPKRPPRKMISVPLSPRSKRPKGKCQILLDAYCMPPNV